ncbi:MAG TPA: hypothetical protein VHJ83_13360 [Micromonosporaceae bacterium]|nr:hypothetical protein [Micromonosporaceae bacterium]
MDALIALGGALLGGFLVLLGDVIRRRVEWKRENVRRLGESSTAFAALYNRMCGELIDARERGVPVHELPDIRPERYETVTRFFLTPGSEKLREPAVALIRVYRDMVDAYAEEDRWKAAWEAHFKGIRRFEAAVREALRRGSI